MDQPNPAFDLRGAPHMPSALYGRFLDYYYWANLGDAFFFFFWLKLRRAY